MIIFFAALVAILYYLGIMQRVVRWVGGAIGWVTGISRVESLGAAANIFVGQSESPLVVRPYLAALPPSHLFTLMTVGMAGVAGTILAAYAGLLGDEYLPFLLAAAFMSAPGGILMAKMIMPDELAAPGELPLEGGVATAAPEDQHRRRHVRGGRAPGQYHHGRRAGRADRRQAGGRGRRDGAGVRRPGRARQRLARRDRRLVRPSRPQLPGDRRLRFAPVMYPDRHPVERGGIAGGLFGTKIVLNEFVAFIDLGAPGRRPRLASAAARLSPSLLCGFANFSSIAIQMAVTGGLAPNQRPMIAKLGLKALLAGCSPI